MFAQHSITKLVAVALLTLTFTGPASASDDEGGWSRGWGMGHMMRGRGRGPMMGYGEDAMLDRIDGRLAFLKTELKITEAQSEAWNEMATTIRMTSEIHNKMMREMMKEMHDGEFFKKPLPDRLVLHETHMEARLEQIKAVREAVDKLYVVLDDTQKKAADEIMLPTMGMGMGGMMGVGRGMMMQQ